MNVRAGSGWQTVLADLSLILFMVTGAALSQAGPDAAAAPAAPSPRGEPVAVWRAGTGAPPLGQWLAAVDPRTRLTLSVHYGPGGAAPALERASGLVAAAKARGRDVRVLVEPGDGADEAVLAYDAAPLARDLQNSATKPADKESGR